MGGGGTVGDAVGDDVGVLDLDAVGGDVGLLDFGQGKKDQSSSQQRASERVSGAVSSVVAGREQAPIPKQDPDEIVPDTTLEHAETPTQVLLLRYVGPAIL